MNTVLFTFTFSVNLFALNQSTNMARSLSKDHQFLRQEIVLQFGESFISNNLFSSYQIHLDKFFLQANNSVKILKVRTFLLIHVKAK